MIDKHNILNKIFGKLTVIEFVGSKRIGKNQRFHRIWKCKCICGAIKDIPGSQLRAGKTKSCGCSTKEYRSKNSRKSDGYNATTQVYLAYKNGAARRKIEFNLSRKDIVDLIFKNCYYCNSAPKTVKGKNFKSGSILYNGIDRIDNNSGYNNNNVVTCCEMCNRAKLDYTQKQFYDWVKKLYINLKEKI